jgi:hypothetical protein
MLAQLILPIFQKLVDKTDMMAVNIIVVKSIKRVNLSNLNLKPFLKNDFISLPSNKRKIMAVTAGPA